MINSSEPVVNQDNREIVIKKLDESIEDVKLEDLFLFDLSPYYKEKTDESFFFKQLEYVQEKNVLSHNSRISFTSEQIRIYNGIVENRRTIVSAPTSFGKTMLVKEYVYNYKPDKVVFIVPTNSLADELLDDFKLLFIDLGYVIFDSIKNIGSISGKSIFIGTQEKYYNIKHLYEESVDLFVIDEAYKLTDPIKGSREVILNRSFMDTLESSEKMVLLMPLVNSIAGLDNLNFEILKSDYAPVAKTFRAIKDLDEHINEEISKNETTNIIYFNSPKILEENYLKHFNEIKNRIDLNDGWFQRVEEDFHSEWLPIQALKSGIGIHYGPMPKFIQKKVVELFKLNKIKNVLATNSIIEGVNTPTKNIYIHSSRDILGGKNLVKYKNLIGRAGRLGEHKVGNIFYWHKHKRQFEQANVSYKEINIHFVLESTAEIVEINREDYNDSVIKPEGSKSLENNLKDYLEQTNYSKVPEIEVSNLLNKHGFTVRKFRDFIDYSENKNMTLLGVVGKLAGTVDLTCFNVALKREYTTFRDMVEELHFRNNEKAKSLIISSLIDMIYSSLPFKVIPVINFVIDIDDLYKKYTSTDLIPRNVINEAKVKKTQFYKKYIGLEDVTIDTLVVINKLFEYGIPYQRVKPVLGELTAKLPSKFSIHDIKRIVFESESMKDLKVYFE